MKALLIDIDMNTTLGSIFTAAGITEDILLRDLLQQEGVTKDTTVRELINLAEEKYGK